MVRKVSALDARKRLGQLLEEVYCKGDQYVIERAGRPMAAVVPVWQLEERAKSRERFFKTVKGLWKHSEGVKSEVIEREISEAIQAARRKAKPKKA